MRRLSGGAPRASLHIAVDLRLSLATNTAMDFDRQKMDDKGRRAVKLDALARREPAPPVGEMDFKKPAADNSGVEGEGVLSIPPRMYRQYAEEFKELARTATSLQQRTLYLKMANIWASAAVQFESGSETSDEPIPFVI